MRPRDCRFPVLFVLAALAGAAEEKPTEGTARSTDGLSVAYDVRGNGNPALVFVHGWCGDRSFWKEQLDAFAKEHRVVRLDLGGHGKSGKDRALWSVDAMASDVEAVVRALDLKQAVLVGHSMGGPISLLVAKRMPGRIAAVVGVDTLHNVEFRWPEEQTKQVLAGFEADFEGTVRGFLKGTFPEKTDPALFQLVLDKALAADRRMAVGLMRSLSAFDAKAALEGAKVPVRCINAAPATLYSMPTAVDVNRKHGDFDAVLMEGVGHFPMLEKPAEFNEKLRAGLAALGPKKEE